MILLYGEAFKLKEADHDKKHTRQTQTNQQTNTM